MMRFKNIYVEITNICNLNCPFCMKDNRIPRSMSIEEFRLVINKIKNYTKGIYLHVKGEPLIYPNLKALLQIAKDNNVLVNITTNGTLLKKNLSTILGSTNIRQINISLHSNLNNDSYLNEIFESTNEIINKTNVYINYRLWNIYTSTDIVEIINNYYNVDITKSNKIKDNLYIEMEHKFDWPTIDRNYYNETGKCYGLINQIAILVNGDIVPCCLDCQGIIKLGNIFEDDLETVINCQRAQDIIKGFKNNRKVEELCKHCNFLEKRK